MSGIDEYQCFILYNLISMSMICMFGLTLETVWDHDDVRHIFVKCLHINL